MRPGRRLASLPRFPATDRTQNFATEKSRSLLHGFISSESALTDFLAPLKSTPVGIDQTDGLRITLSTGDIVHLRPSGNAPELRCYAEAASQAQAALLASTCLQRIQTLAP